MNSCVYLNICVLWALNQVPGIQRSTHNPWHWWIDVKALRAQGGILGWNRQLAFIMPLTSETPEFSHQREHRWNIHISWRSSHNRHWCNFQLLSTGNIYNPRSVHKDHPSNSSSCCPFTVYLASNNQRNHKSHQILKNYKTIHDIHEKYQKKQNSKDYKKANIHFFFFLFLFFFFYFLSWKIGLCSTVQLALLSWLAFILKSERSPVRFPVRAHALLAGSVPIWGMFGSQPMDVSLSHQCFSLSPSLPLSLKINEILKKCLCN